MGGHAEAIERIPRLRRQRTAWRDRQPGADGKHGDPAEPVARQAQSAQDLVVADRLGHGRATGIAAANEEDEALGEPVYGGAIAPEGRDHEDDEGGEEDAGPGKLIAARRFPAEEPRQGVRRDHAREEAGAAIQGNAVRVLAMVQVDPGPEHVEAGVEDADDGSGDETRGSRKKVVKAPGAELGPGSGLSPMVSCTHGYTPIGILR